jgi:hypothetical protein
MRFGFRQSAAPWVALAVLACGGSSSETPFPEPPLPAYLKPKAAPADSAPAASDSAPTASDSVPAAAPTTVVAPTAPPAAEPSAASTESPAPTPTTPTGGAE